MTAGGRGASGDDGKDAAARRKARPAAELRTNLARRKGQAKARRVTVESLTEAPGPTHSTQDDQTIPSYRKNPADQKSLAGQKKPTGK